MKDILGVNYKDATLGSVCSNVYSDVALRRYILIEQILITKEGI